MELPSEILEKHCPSMNDLFLDDQGRNFRDRVIAAMEEYAVAYAYTTEYTEWKVKTDQAKALFEKILSFKHQNYDNEITIGIELINEIKSFLDGK